MAFLPQKPLCMKLRNAFTIVLAVTTALLVQNLRAQEDEPRTQGLVVWEDHVPPSKADVYEKGTKAMLEMYAKHEFPHEVNIYSSEDYRYFWVVTVDRFADIDTLYREFNRIYNELGEEGNAKLDEAIDGTFSHSKVWTCLWRSDLSYMPENPADTGDFRFWGFMHVKQGKQKEMRDIMKQWVDLYESKGIDRGFGGYIGDIGTDMPFMFYSERGQNPAEFYAAGEKINEKLGEEADALWKKTEALLRGFEPVRGWYRKDLSYSPK